MCEGTAEVSGVHHQHEGEVSVHTVHDVTFIVTCVGRSKALPVPLLPVLYEACGMTNMERSITKLLNDDAILAHAHPVMES